MVVVRLGVDNGETKKRERGESRRESESSSSLAATAAREAEKKVTWFAHVCPDLAQCVTG
jgi:hypothetical protein